MHTIAVLDIALVPAAFPVGFALLTHGERQYVAYYDVEHHLTVAARDLGATSWQYQVLPTRVGWDSHNYVVMAVDDAGQLHLSGNMHCVPLIYFRTTRPGDITSFIPVPRLTGEAEDRCTYPAFLRDTAGRLIFHFRDGSSGNGNERYAVYRPATDTWQRLLDRPLTDGHGRMNAYMAGPTRGPDGLFHLCWVWRDTPDCATNHDPSYARSRDLIHWETIAGQPITLPLTLETPGVLIDAVPIGAGLLNGNLRIGFDHQQRPVAAYHKFDAAGYTQLFVARYEDGRWQPRPATRWTYRWAFSGWGSIANEIHVGTLCPHGPGELALPYRHSQYGTGCVILDDATLAPLRVEPPPARYPAALLAPGAPALEVHWQEDCGTAPGSATRYVLRWETQPQNRDQRPPDPHPAPGMLRVIELAAE